MIKYAMICNSMVIGIVDEKVEWPPDAAGNPVIAISCDESVALGMVYDPETNTFSEYVPPEPEIPEEPAPTQLDNIEATQLTIMTAMAEQYEESLERELTNMEVQATIYEAILELGGAE